MIDLANPVNSEHPLNRGRVAWWLTVPALGGGRQWYDLMGLQHATLTSMGNASNGWRNATRLGAQGQLLFDGTAGCVAAPNSPRFDFGSNDFAITWWEYRTTNINGPSSFMRDSTAVSFTPFLLGFSTGGATLQVYMTSNKTAWDIASGKSLGSVTLNAWNQFAVTRNGTTFISYKNAQQVDTWTSSLALAAGTGTLGIGGPYNAGTLSYFSGAMDDVSLYGRGLSAAEVFALYGLSRQGYPGALNRVDEPFWTIPPVVRDMVALIAGQATVTATMTRLRGLSATIAAQGAVTATLTRLRGLIAIIQAQGAVTATMTRLRGLIAVIAGQSVVTVSMTRLRGLMARILGSVTITAILSILRPERGCTKLTLSLRATQALSFSECC